jgi:hypothetical protein
MDVDTSFLIVITTNTVARVATVSTTQATFVHAQRAKAGGGFSTVLNMVSKPSWSTLMLCDPLLSHVSFPLDVSSTAVVLVFAPDTQIET